MTLNRSCRITAFLLVFGSETWGTKTWSLNSNSTFLAGWANLMLWRGDGVPRDASRAIDYWLRARKAGEPRADAQLQAHLPIWTYWHRVLLPAYRAAALQWLEERLRSTL